jgi:DNA-binding MarR family transcriptional regulator
MTQGTRTPVRQLERGIERELIALVHRARRDTTEHARLVHPELQAAGYGVLVTVAQHQPTRACELVQLLDVDKGAVSRQVAQLERLGLVERTADPTDGRVHTLSLSPAGEERMAAVRRRWDSEFRGRLTSWSAEQLTAFVEGLQRYNGSPRSVSHRAPGPTTG